MSDSKTPENGDEPIRKVEPEVIEADAVTDDTPTLESEPVETPSEEEKKSSPVFSARLGSFPAAGIIILATACVLLIGFFILRGLHGSKPESATPKTAAIESQQYTPQEQPSVNESATAEITSATPTQATATEEPAKMGEAANQVLPSAPLEGLTQRRDRVVNETVSDEQVLEQVPEVADTQPATAAPETTVPSQLTIQQQRAQLEAQAQEKAQARIAQQKAEREAKIQAATGEAAEVTTESISSLNDAAALDVLTPPDPIDTTTTLADNTLLSFSPPGENAETPASEKIANEPLPLEDSSKAQILLQTQTALAAERLRLEQERAELDALKNDIDAKLAERDEDSNRRIAELEQQLKKLENNAAQQSGRQFALSLALTGLKDQIATGRPFVEQLAIVEKLSPEKYRLESLKPYAEAGLPSMVSLQSSFDIAARAGLANARRSEKGGLMTSLANLFNARPIGDVTGDTPSAIIARTEVRLDRGDLEAALKELDALDGPAAESMAEWQKDAEALLKAQNVLNSLQHQVLQTLQ